MKLFYAKKNEAKKQATSADMEELYGVKMPDSWRFNNPSDN